MKKKWLSLVLLPGMLLSLLSGCASEEAEETEEEEVLEAQTLTVSDPEYYTRFKDDGISINVYNWGEYIAVDDGEEGAFDTNAEFEALTGIKVNYTNFSSNEEMYAKLKSGGASYDVI
ncbi:MAG: spermidine/putrescine ABC transporter substrate-binding protein, partial [Oscillospiraceae bacterium]|nr:spermidine/putrescine ABC transporter substrate-binding protein [Oscillospiraceae bacterium]